MPSVCYLYYSYKDIAVLRSMIKKDENGTPETLKIHLQNLNDVVYYCTNNVECRRVQVLRYFGENFSANNCSINKSAICDNCSQAVSSHRISPERSLTLLIVHSLPRLKTPLEHVPKRGLHSSRESHSAVRFQDTVVGEEGLHGEPLRRHSEGIQTPEGDERRS